MTIRNDYGYPNIDEWESTGVSVAFGQPDLDKKQHLWLFFTQKLRDNPALYDELERQLRDGKEARIVVETRIVPQRRDDGKQGVLA